MINEELDRNGSIIRMSAHSGFKLIIRRIKILYAFTIAMIILFLLFFIINFQFVVSKFMVFILIISIIFFSFRYFPTIIYPYEYRLTDKGILGWKDVGNIFIRVKEIYYPYSELNEIIFLQNVADFNKNFITHESKSKMLNKHRINTNRPSIIIFPNTDDVIILEFNDVHSSNKIKTHIKSKTNR